MADPGSYVTAARTGLRRAGFHMLKAGYEVLSGVGALLEELAAVRGEPEDDRPTRIPVEPADDEVRQRIVLDDETSES